MFLKYQNRINNPLNIFKMIQFSSLRLLQHVRFLLSKHWIREADLEDATPTAVVAGDDVPTAISKLQAQLSAIISSS